MLTKINYIAHPTLAKFHASDASVRGIMGPFGSGKSVGMCVEVLSRSMQQAPDSNGVRRTRWAVIRNTYPELRSTTIKTWETWIPQAICPIKWSAPIEAHMRRKLPDGTEIDMLVYFLSIDRPTQVRKVLSMELTGAWFNECREADLAIITALIGRCSRYPSPDIAELTWSGVLLDTNPPDDDSWYYNLAENVKPDGWEFFRQPGALVPILDTNGHVKGYEANPAAENIQHLQRGYQYYMNMASGADPEWVKVHCCGDYGTVFDGKPVYDQIYRDQVHFSPKPLGYFRGLPLIAGWDFGLTPACIIGQVDPKGQLRVLREYICVRGGIRQFVTEIVQPALKATFPGARVISYADPAGKQASQVDETSCFEELERLGFPVEPANSNDFLKRRTAVINWLTRMIDGKPAFLLDPACQTLKKGFIGGYHFRRVQAAGDARFRDRPNKNKFSHPHDALQYLCQGVSDPFAFAVDAKPVLQESTWDGMA